MTTYNHERFIADAIDSVLMQDVNFPWELVVGDDCSQDATRQILQDYALRYPGVIRPLLHSTHHGMTANVAATHQACRGEYIAFLEGDDYWTDREKLKLQVAFMERHPDCAVHHHRVSYLHDRSGEIIQEFPPPARRNERTDAALLADSNFIQTCSAIARSEQIPPITDDYLKLRLVDWPMFAILGQEGWIGYTDRNMAVYRIHDSNSWYLKSDTFTDQATHQMARFLVKTLRDPHREIWTNTVLTVSERLLKGAETNGSLNEFASALGATFMDTLRYRSALSAWRVGLVSTLRFVRRRTLKQMRSRSQGSRGDSH